MLSGTTPQSRAMRPPVDLRFVAAASLLLSLWLILIEPVINRDAIIYLRTADAYLRDGLMASLGLFDRPFLSIIMAWLHQLTGLSLLHAGLVFSAVFFAILSTSFVSVVRLLGGDHRVQLIAAIVIISHPLLAHGRDSIMRDAPFWAFSLLAFRALLIYQRQHTVTHQIQWFCFVAIASLFRFESVFFAVLAPLAVFLASDQSNRLRISLRLVALPLTAIVAVTLVIILIQTVIMPGSQLFPAITGYIDKLTSLPQVFNDVSSATGEALLFFTAKSDANIAVIAGLAAILVVNICRAIMWPYVIVLIWGRAQNLFPLIPRQARILLNAHLIIALIYLALFTLTNRFMLERYCHIFTIFVALYLPFLLNAALAPGRRPVTKILALLVLVGMCIDVSGSLGNRKIYKKEASQWLTSNTPTDATILSNSKYIAYFSGRETDWSNLGAITFKASDLNSRPDLWRKVDYIVVRVKRGESEQWASFLQTNSLSELKVFDGERHGTVSIVEVPPRAKPGRGRRY
ncbi:MAG: hypothetical protein IMF06_02025 [Proteobacteria bacterium]|nr:hypothetical protein [Pseudomonadota bacterium]